MRQITERQRAILTGAEIDGCVLVIPEKLDRKDYAAINRLLITLGGVWDRRHKGHVFSADPTDVVAKLLETGEVPRTVRTTEGYVATPPELAQWIVRGFTDLANRDPLVEGVPYVLEPSAGEGALTVAIREADPHADITALEPNRERAARIPRDGTVVRTVRLEDYLHSPEARWFDLAVANPPFAVPGRPTIWIDHTWHTWSLLRPGGRLVSIAPNGLTFRDDRQHVAVRALIERYGGGWHDLEEGAFAASGTDVHAVVFWIDKPEDWTLEDDQPPKRQRGKPSPDEQAQRRAEDHQLRQAADEGLDDEEYVEDMTRRLSRLPSDCRLLTYSPRNQALVLNQCDAMGVRVTGHLNTFKGWLEEGRVVREGQKSIRITAAMGDEEEKPEDQQKPEDGKEPKKRFRMTTRFDFSQTKGLDGAADE